MVSGWLKRTRPVLRRNSIRLILTWLLDGGRPVACYGRMIALLKIATVLLTDAPRFVFNSLRSRRSLAAENLFLRHQLALYRERGLKPRRIDAATRVSLTWLSSLCD